MTETETIPEDVRQMAVQFRCCSSDGCIRADDECGEQGLCIEGRQIARAILAERERCARVAERDGSSHDATMAQQTAQWHSRVTAEVRAADRIAAAIRATP